MSQTTVQYAIDQAERSIVKCILYKMREREFLASDPVRGTTKLCQYIHCD